MSCMTQKDYHLPRHSGSDNRKPALPCFGSPSREASLSMYAFGLRPFRLSKLIKPPGDDLWHITNTPRIVARPSYHSTRCLPSES